MLASNVYKILTATPHTALIQSYQGIGSARKKRGVAKHVDTIPTASPSTTALMKPFQRIGPARIKRRVANHAGSIPTAALINAVVYSLRRADELALN